MWPEIVVVKNDYANKFSLFVIKKVLLITFVGEIY